VEIEESRGVLTIKRNELNFTAAVPTFYVHKINSVAFLDFAPETVRCVGVGAVRQHENGIKFWAVTYTFWVKLHLATWRLRVLDAGLRELISTPAPGVRNHARIIDPYSGVAVSAPYPLDGSGRKYDPNTDPFTYLEFDVYEKADFNALAFVFDL
jgi:hypothetical protein